MMISMMNLWNTISPIPGVRVTIGPLVQTLAQIYFLGLSYFLTGNWPARGTVHFSTLPGTRHHPHTENISWYFVTISIPELHHQYQDNQLRTCISPKPFLLPLIYWPVYLSPLGHSNLKWQRKLSSNENIKEKAISSEMNSNLPWPSIRFIRICPVYLATHRHAHIHIGQASISWS